MVLQHCGRVGSRRALSFHSARAIPVRGWRVSLYECLPPLVQHPPFVYDGNNYLALAY